MTKILLARWRDKRSCLGLEATDQFLDLSILLRHHRFFQVHTLLNLILLFSALLALFNKLGRVLLFSMIAYGVFLFFRTRKIAQSFSLKRTHPKKAIEMDPIQVQFELSNESPFDLDSVLVLDLCSASQKPKQTVGLNQPLEAFSSYIGTYRRKCDGGMGIRMIGPYRAWISDPIGLHEFHVYEESKNQIEVYPRFEPILDPDVKGSHESHFFGIYDVPVRGQSVNFMGIREYSPGDSLRQMSWKLSAKHRKLLVKEFERSVNAEITLALNMRGSLHMGYGSQSTWEKAKDLTLALVANQARNGNSVQLISNDHYLPWGQGDAHIHDTVLKIFDTFPQQVVSRHDPLEGMQQWVPPYSTVFYVTPVFTQTHQNEWNPLLLLKEKNVSVQCYLIDAASFIQDQIQGDYKFAERVAAGEGNRNLKLACEILNRHGVDVYVIRMNDSFTECLKRKVLPADLGSTP